MIAKYGGICRYCGKAIKPGEDEYEPESKTSFHVQCAENQPPSAEQIALAERLGYRHYSWDELRSDEVGETRLL